MINWKNTTENLILVLITSIAFLVLGVGIGYKVSINAINTQQEIIIKAIDKNTTEIVNEFSKIKNKKGEPIIINLDNEATTNGINLDSSSVTKKKGFFKKLFSK